MVPRTETIAKVLVRVTTACNIRCAHCYVKSDPKEYQILTGPELENIVDELSKCRVEYISFTGGQPTLIGEGLLKILHYASELRKTRGYPIFLGVTTNSSIGKDEATADYWAKGFKEAGLDRVKLSCDSWHREFLPESFEQRVIQAVQRYGLHLKIVSVASPQDKVAENKYIDDDNKILALRPGGNATNDDYNAGWCKTSKCRIYDSRLSPGQVSLFLHTTRDIHICNVGIAPELSMGKLLEDDLYQMVFGKAKGLVGSLCDADVPGLARFIGADLDQLDQRIKEVGRCAACNELRKNYLQQ